MNANYIKHLSGFMIILMIMSSCATENKSVLEKFKAGQTKLYVCPVHVLENKTASYDTVSSIQIVNYINGKNYSNAELTDIVPPPNNTWVANEAKMLTNSITIFVEFVKQSKLPDGSYILYTEFLRGGPEKRVYAVHYSLVNNLGEQAMRGLINSHWEAFQKVNPITNADCVSVFINGFEDKMKE